MLATMKSDMHRAGPWSLPAPDCVAQSLMHVCTVVQQRSPHAHKPLIHQSTRPTRLHPHKSTNTMSSSVLASSSNSTSVTPSSTISIPQTAAAGGVSITQPPSTASASYYKIAQNEYITFGWNLTSL